MPPIILPMDQYSSLDKLVVDLKLILSDPTARALIAYIKFNDGMHLDDGGPNVFREVQRVIDDTGSTASRFLDLKIADTKDTNLNTLGRYGDLSGCIVTVRDSVSAAGWLALRRKFPKAKLALVSVLTDTPEEECRERNGMSPTYKILVDIDNINHAYAKIRTEADNPEPFDMIVCSPLEVNELFQTCGHRYQFIVPGIRDAWMSAGQQARFTGIREALKSGATYVVAGAQLTKGNPKADSPVSAQQSREWTYKEVEAANHVIIVPGNPLATLDNCDGFYESPIDGEGCYAGPLVAYTGTYKNDVGEQKNYVGFCYFNFSRAEDKPLVLLAFCRWLADKIKATSGVPDVLMAMPMGSVFLTVMLGKFLGCRIIFAEKKIITPADSAKGTKEVSILILGRHAIRPGETVGITEDVCNNFSTTNKAVELIENSGGIFHGVYCEINRSNLTEWHGQPVTSLVHKPSPEFRQDDPAVAELIAAGKIFWNPKSTTEWRQLKLIMERGY
ncbi:MAG: orotidine 5'-phosphate decarboxylase / HUMPS family protein [Candidatus Falkowbacteria bacterium]